MSSNGTPGQVSGALGIKQWNQFIPPGWKPHQYPLKEYEDYLSLWAKVTSLSEEKIGPAIASRLEGSALRVALELTVDRTDPTSGVVTMEVDFVRPHPQGPDV